MDVGSGAGVSRVVIVGAGTTTITATAVDDALVEGDVTGLLSFELGGTLDPLFTLDPVPDLALRLVDDDVNNPAEGPYTLLTEGFETDGNGVRYTTSIPEFSDGSTDFFVRTNGANISSAYEVSGEVGSFFFAGQDIDAANVAGGGGPNAATLSFTGIDISDFENLSFSALIAEDDNGIFQDLDTTDGLRIRAQIDGGGFFDILGFESGGDQSNEVPQQDTDLNGIGEGAALTDTFRPFAADIAGTGNTLDLQIGMQASFANEGFAIDDIRVTGDVGPFFTLNGQQIAGGNSVPDALIPTIDGVDDFSGSTASTSFELSFVGAESASELLLGDTIRVIQQGGTSVSIDVEATVAATNLDGGVVLLESPEFPGVFGVTQLVLLDAPLGNGVPVSIEVGPSTPPLLVSSSPADEATEVPVDSAIDLDFDEPVVAGTGFIELRRSSDGSLLEQIDVTSPGVSFAGTIISFTPSADLPPGEELFVNVTPGAIRDLQGNPFIGIDDAETLDFTVAIPTDVASIIVTTPGTSQAHVLTPAPTAVDPVAYQLLANPDSASVSIQPTGQFSYSAPTLPGVEPFFYEMTDFNAATTAGRVDVQIVDGLIGLSLTATSANDVIRETDQNDSVDASDGDDLLILGLPGADVIFGGIGQDIADYSQASQDVNIQLSSGVNGGAAAGDQLNGIEHVVATTFNDILTGDGASNTLTGLAGNDTLNGGAGNDTMDGGTGADLLRGGADADTFEFNTGDGPDTIIDFEVGTDTIDLSATGLSFGDLTITDIGVNATIAYGTDMITVFNTTAAQPDQNQFDFGP